MIFSELETISPPLQLAAWLGCAFFIIAGWNQVEEWFARRKERPSAGEVRADAVDRFVSKAEYLNATAQNQKDHENLFSKIGGVERGVEARLTARLNEMEAAAIRGRERIHERLSIMDHDLGGLKASDENHTRELQSVDTKLDAMPERLIANLKNTGAI